MQSAPVPAPPVLAALACNLDTDILTAALPLLAEGRVEALEWSFDVLSQTEQLPAWFAQLLDTYSTGGRLLGHGVFYSLLSGRWQPAQQQWLQQLRTVTQQLPFAHVSEHFGFFTGQHFHAGAPLPVPYTTATLRLGQDRMQRLAQAGQCPVGLENLAFAYSVAEVQQHGEFLGKLLEPVNGFIILDLHNLYCQLHNFSASFDELLGSYPLDRVREIHISGGSWAPAPTAPAGRVRRDTHDAAVPEEVFHLLEQAMPRCHNLRYVVLEQLGTALTTPASHRSFRRDFRRMARLVEQHRASQSGTVQHDFRPPPLSVPESALEDEVLYEQQQQLSHILETAASYAEAQDHLRYSSLASSAWQIEHWAPHMLETARQIARKWQQAT
ncbi:DUF692 family multinuclear iron-containing protein [Hymenobacter sp. 102]|uniref:multinuclear nonheme iron-dependent oxidase n=1 Tax=Hymenobacter sp. 102 TaxID=3403152 RepID=UPI003CF806E9